MKQCDLCDRPVPLDQGYLLNTQQIVASADSWSSFFIKTQGRHPGLLDDSVRLMSVAYRRASDDTPWVVCERCSAMFSFDRPRSRKDLEKYRRTGEFEGGHAVCEVSAVGKDTVVRPLKDETWDVMLDAIAMGVEQFRKVCPRAK